MSMMDQYALELVLSVLQPCRHLFNVLRLLNQLVTLNILAPRALMSFNISTGLYNNWNI